MIKTAININNKTGIYIGSTFTFTVIVLLMYLWLRPAAPKQIRSWYQTPDVVVCDLEDTNIQQIEDALKWWANHDQSSGTITEQETCPKFPLEGTIVITEGAVPQGTMGVTLTSWIEDEILSANITLPSKAYYGKSPNSPDYVPQLTEKIITHELGHAFGYLHLNQNGHIMAPNIDRLGWNDEGIGS